ncbi:hypothetical protein XENOCAPTIV_012201 [Xenoophorus captivus]|uniref:Uncharacterized protein n=1 Tax=Xenoophorus captivus TaxID=1517983 RepID=A0ABV0RYK2_9TELE
MTDTKANASFTVEDLTSLQAKLKKELAAEFKSSFESLTSKLDHINTAICDHGGRITSLEEEATTIDQHHTELAGKYNALQKDNGWLKDKLADLEGQSRRLKIQIRG